MGSVVAFGFAAFALAGGFVAQSFEGLKEGTIRSIGHLQVVDRRAVKQSEEATLEFGLKDAGRARAIAARSARRSFTSMNPTIVLRRRCSSRPSSPLPSRCTAS